MKRGKYMSKLVVVKDTNQRAYISENDAEMDARAVEAVRASISKAIFCKKPVARYDLETKRAYIEYPNGERKYVD